MTDQKDRTPIYPAEAPTVTEVIEFLHTILEEAGDLPVLLADSFRERWEIPAFKVTSDRTCVYIDDSGGSIGLGRQD